MSRCSSQLQSPTMDMVPVLSSQPMLPCLAPAPTPTSCQHSNHHAHSSWENSMGGMARGPAALGGGEWVGDAAAFVPGFLQAVTKRCHPGCHH